MLFVAMRHLLSLLWGVSGVPRDGPRVDSSGVGTVRRVSIAYLGCARYPSESNDGPTLQLFLERRELCKSLAGQGRIESDCRARSRTFKSCMVASLPIQGTARF